MNTERGLPINPVLLAHAQERLRHTESRIADAITRFAGSMQFVYLHVLWFGVWIIFEFERYPFGLLTMIVSLEAIFLSTFVMISQNLADEKRQVLADHEWQTVQKEELQNEALLNVTMQLLERTRFLQQSDRRAVRRWQEPVAPRSGSRGQALLVSRGERPRRRPAQVTRTPIRATRG